MFTHTVHRTCTCTCHFYMHISGVRTYRLDNQSFFFVNNCKLGAQLPNRSFAGEVLQQFTTMSGPGPHNLDRVPDQDGYLIINGDGAVMASSGELENDERIAGILMNMVRLASRVKINPDKPETFKRLSVVFDDFMYVVTISSSKVYVSKRRHCPRDPVIA